MRKYIESTKPFIIIIICFITIIFSVKLIELSNALSSGMVIEDFSGIIYGNIIAALFIGSCIFIIYNIISFISRKTALIVAALLFSIMVFAETALIIYHKTTGLLMGVELIDRPLWETLQTIRSVTDIWMIPAFIVAITLISFLFLKFSKRKIRNLTNGIVLCLMIISIPLTFILKPNQDKNIVNKTWYCLHSCISEKQNNKDIVLSTITFDNDKIEKYRSLYPERIISDNEYPLERTDNINNVLGNYFKKSDKKPDLVFVVVESLGADLFGVNEYGYTFTPFLDSLSKHSLLWTNCLSTTPRSFGVVPAITGSVPHGKRGFQFGNIPEHNSLYSVLKNNDYESWAFYAGDFSFDKVYDYLVAQDIDYMSPFYKEISLKKNKIYDHTYWGYQDMVMFDKSAEIIKQRDKEKSYIDLLISISQHDNELKLNDKNKVYEYNKRVSEILSDLPHEEQEKKKDITGYLAATLYGDDAVKHFVKKYTEYHEGDDYIFIITGDHSLNLNPDNPLDAFHVPLIIWSPSLTKTARFEAVVSHNDIVPSLNALLRDNYNLKTPEKIHWMGAELDTTQTFHCNLKTSFLKYTRTIHDGIYDNYYYTFENNSKKAFAIKEKLELEEVKDLDILNDIDDKFKTLIYVDNYAYTNNKVTKHPIFTHKSFSVLKEFFIDSVYCESPSEKPSVEKPKEVSILSTKIERNEFDEIKIIMTADVIYTGNVWQDQFIGLGVKYSNGKKVEINSSDNISKSFTDGEYHQGTWTKMEFSKIFSANGSDKNEFEIYLKPTEKDYMWNPEHSVKLKNINIMILGN